MLGVVRELADRYGRHSSFPGVAVVLSADGYAQLPGSNWGYDDDTVAAYERDMGVRVPGVGADRFMSRDRVLSGEQRSTWLEWRAGKLADFHRLMQAEVARIKPDAKLFLASSDALSGRDSRAELSPMLPRTVSVPQALLQVGIDLENYADDDNVVLTRPAPIGPLDNLYRDAGRAVDLAITQATNVDARFVAARTTASLLYHPPQQGRLESFEKKSPFQPTYSWQVAQLSPAGAENRKRFVHAIATMDAQAMIDGGWLLPLGQEDNLEELFEVYRRLPGERFQTVEGATQPVTIRTLERDDRTYVYMVNDSPWPVVVETGVAATAPLRMESLSSRILPPPLRQRGETLIWTVRLEPFDLVGCRFDSAFGGLVEPRVRFTQPDVIPRLARRIEELWKRAEVLKEKRPLAGLENGGFEAPSDRMNEVPGWRAVGGGTPEVTVETYSPHSGAQSLRFLGDGRVSSLWSNTFAPPRTGRLAVSVWLRTADVSRQPPLRLAVEGKMDGASYYRHARVGDAPGYEIYPQWKEFVFPVPDLPLEGLADLRVRFDLMGPGEVWIDDVEIFESAFTQKEITELGSIIKLASDYLQRGQVRDAHHVLEGYWPRFLTDRVTLPPAVIADRNPPLPDRDAATSPTADELGFLQGWKNRLLPKFLR
jgi:hypothetical protein